MKLLNDFFRYWVPVLVWMVIIFYFSGKQRVSVSPEYFVNFIFFKTLHVLEYALLYLLCYRAINVSVSGNYARLRYWVAFLVVIIYAISDEFHQSFVPTREGRVRDVIIDAVGATFAWLCIVRLLPKTQPKLRKLAQGLGLL